MMTQRGVALVFLLAVVSLGRAEVIGRVELIETGIDDLLGNGLFDVYHVILSNPVGDATSAAFTFPGMFLTGTGTTFRDTPELFFGTLGDSFIVRPPLQAPSAVDFLVIDNSTLIDVAYTLPGVRPVVPLGVTTVAVLSVPTGYVPDVSGFSGDLIIDGESVPVNFVPEPAGLALAALSMAGIAARYRNDPLGG